MSSVLELTGSVTKLWASEVPPLPKAAFAQSSPAAASFATLPSNSNGPFGKFPVPPDVVEPKISAGITAFTVTEAVAPAASEALDAVKKSLVLIEVAPNEDEPTVHESSVASGS